MPDCAKSKVENPATTAVRSHSDEDIARKKKADHDLKLRMNGWIKNADGMWVQDPDVEFDSDEHEAPILPD